MTDNPSERDLAQISKALKHPTRQRLLRWQNSREKPGSPREASEDLQQPLPDVAYHVRVLVRAGLFADAGQLPVRGSLQHFYLVDPERRKLPMVARVIEGTG